MSHDHCCIHTYGGKPKTLIALLLNAGVTCIELIGGIFSGSVAIMSDAFNNGADTLALGITYFSLHKMSETPSETMTFGGKRWEIISALIKGVFLVGTGAFLVYQAVLQYMFPETINTMLVLSLASIAFIVNISSVFLLQGGAKKDLNIASTHLCMVYDALSSLAVIIAALLGMMWPKTAFLLDITASVLIVVFMVRSGLGIIRQSTSILLQYTPEEVDFHKVAEVIARVSGVESVHDLHIWTLASGMHQLTCAIIISPSEICHCPEILEEVRTQIKEKFLITHSTIQPEYTHDKRHSLFCCQA